VTSDSSSLDGDPADMSPVDVPPVAASRAQELLDDPVLRGLGLTEVPARAFATSTTEGPSGPDHGAVLARVARIDRGGWLTAMAADGAVRARQHPRFRRVMDALELPTVGDWVVLRPDPGGGPLLADQVLPRHSVFVRGDEGHARVQAVAANVDVVFLLLSATMAHNERRTDRMLSLAWASGAQPVVVVTKADAVDDLDARVALIEDAVKGVPVHVVSAHRGEGLDDLLPHLGPGRTAALLGASGVGKSTLANWLLGGDALATGAVRRDGKGRHTTTHRELLRLPDGGLLIDTPGLRSVGLFDRDDAADDQTFADVDALAAACRFADCAHGGEPGCAVREALDSGVLQAGRWERYAALLEEATVVAQRQEEGLRAAETRRYRARREASARRPQR